MQGPLSTPGSAAFSPADEPISPAASPAAPSSCGANSAASPLSTPEQPSMDKEWQPQGSAAGEGEEEVTVVHNGMVITHVPASEVSKVG